ncbi:MAG: hypothetical protein HZA67_03905 [Rhodospirillales bacterium]|nr:hypothetical protein [Rhodospirillales bacterium]
MSRPENKPSWLNTLAIVGVAAFFIWLALPLFKERGERPTSDSGPPGYFHLSPGERKIQLSSAFVQAKSIASARHVSPVEIRNLLNQFAQDHDKIDAEILNKALDERWPMK